MDQVDIFIGVLVVSVLFVLSAIIVTVIVEIVADVICNRKKMDTEYPIGNEPKGEE